MRQYSPFFQTLYDELAPVGQLGRGTHYSVLRCVVWQDETRMPIPIASALDFAIVWDEDHDERVVDLAIELYVNGLLSPAIFLGERKGSFSLLLDVHTESAMGVGFLAYQTEVDALSQSGNDPWAANVGSYCNDEGNIINDDVTSIRIYLENIKRLWRLGVKPLPSAWSHDHSAE